MKDDAITLDPTDAGYRVLVGGVWIGGILLRIYTGAQRVEDGTALATPASINAPSERFRSIGTALDYLLSCEAPHDLPDAP